MKFKIIHHVDQPTIDQMYQKYSPIFVLSTGRSGSKFITKLFESSKATAKTPTWHWFVLIFIFAIAFYFYRKRKQKK